MYSKTISYCEDEMTIKEFLKHYVMSDIPVRIIEDDDEKFFGSCRMACSEENPIFAYKDYSISVDFNELIIYARG